MAAAKDTWGLFKDRGIDAVINDSLVNMGTWSCLGYIVLDELNCALLALTWGGYIVGLLCALFAFLYLHCKLSSKSDFAVTMTDRFSQSHTHRTTPMDNTQYQC